MSKLKFTQVLSTGSVELDAYLKENQQLDYCEVTYSVQLYEWGGNSLLKRDYNRFAIEINIENIEYQIASYEDEQVGHPYGDTIAYETVSVLSKEEKFTIEEHNNITMEFEGYDDGKFSNLILIYDVDYIYIDHEEGKAVVTFKPAV